MRLLPRRLTLASLKAAIGLVDDIGPAAAADYPAVAMAQLQRLQAIANLHGRAPASFVLVECVGRSLVRPTPPLRGGALEVKISEPGTRCPFSTHCGQSLAIPEQPATTTSCVVRKT